MKFFGFASGGGRDSTARTGDENLLVKAAQHGDRRAFDALVEIYIGPLRGFLARRVPSSALEDVLQETLLGAWTSLPRFHPAVSFKAWLYRIALNKAADRSRADARRALQETTMASGDEWWADTQDSIAAVDRKHWVASLLADLPPLQREVLEMYYYADLTLADIAQLLGRNLNTVKYQFYRAHELAARVMESDSEMSREAEKIGSVSSLDSCATGAQLPQPVTCGAATKANFKR